MKNNAYVRDSLLVAFAGMISLLWQMPLASAAPLQQVVDFSITGDSPAIPAADGGSVDKQVTDARGEKVLINLAEKAELDLATLVQWFAEETGRQITADAASFPGSSKNKIVIFGDIQVDRVSIYELVQSILKTNGFAIVESQIENIYQVVPLSAARPFTKLVKPGEEKEFPRGEYVTGVFTLEQINPADAANYVRQLLLDSSSNQAANITTIPSQNVIIVTETAARMTRIADLLSELDVPSVKVQRKFYSVQHGPAEDLRQQLESILGRGNSGTAQSGSATASSSVQLNTIPRTNQLLLSGSRFQIQEALELIEKLDIDDGSSLRTYQFTFISASRVDQLIKSSLGELSESERNGLYKANVDEQNNGLIVTALPEIHQRIDRLRQQLDMESTNGAARSPVRFYTLKNVKAVDILETLTSVVGRISNQSGVQRNDSLELTQQFDNSVVTTGNQDTIIDPFSDLRRREQQERRQNDLLDQTLGALATRNQGPTPGGSGTAVRQGAFPPTGGRLSNPQADSNSVIPGDASLTIDEATNTIIVVAEPEIQRLYADLIGRLDVRRPQVLIEVFVVTLSDDEVESFGIEISGGDRAEGGSQSFAFSNFGLSTVDATNGFLSLTPGLGFNGALINPETADAVIRALSQSDQARVISAPRILVNDNATGVLSSTLEVPFTGTSVGNAAATTSLGGFAQAGTTLSVTPQISDDDYLNLEFDIAVNNFIGTAISDAVPPQRVTDQITSQVSIPDGHTVIVGGLKGQNNANSVTGLPFLRNIPIIKRLTSSTNNGSEQNRLFVFIKPVILRDDKFKDLRVLSSIERRDAELPGDLPYSEPVLIR